MLNDGQAIHKILIDLNNLIDYCKDCAALSTNENAQELYEDTKYDLEGIYHDVSHDVTLSDWDEEDEEDE